MRTVVEAGWPTFLASWFIVGAVVAPRYVVDAQTPEMPDRLIGRLLNPVDFDALDPDPTTVIRRAVVRAMVRAYRGEFEPEAPVAPGWQIVLYEHVLPGLRRLMPRQTVGRHHVGGAR